MMFLNVLDCRRKADPGPSVIPHAIPELTGASEAWVIMPVARLRVSTPPDFRE